MWATQSLLQPLYSATEMIYTQVSMAVVQQNLTHQNRQLAGFGLLAVIY